MSEFLSFHLPEDFIEKYADRQPNWGFDIGGGNTLAELTFITKYSRKKDDGTKERWYETCRRVIEGTWSILKDHCKKNRTPWNENKAQRSAQDAFERMFTFKWLPPGRGIWMMGTEFVHAEQNSAPLQNCFAGDELFITREYGPTAFAEVEDEVVTVWTADGWKKADIRCFGDQRLQAITFMPATSTGNGHRTNHRVVIMATPDHRWLLQGGMETVSLKVGDVVRAEMPTWDDGTEEHWQGVAHGLIFGDGNRITHRYVNGDFGYELRACDKRIMELLEGHENIFDKKNTTRPSANGDPIYYKRSPKDLKGFPVGESVEYVSGFLRGWICADASQTPTGSWVLGSQHPEALSWLRANAATAGWLVVGHSEDRRTTNFGDRAAPLVKITLSSALWKAAWKVTNIEELPEPEPVYCATVQDTAAFTLASGIYTGNCAFVSTEKISHRSVYEATLPFLRLMEMSMHGIGVGFDSKGAGKLTIHTPTAESVVHVVADSREGWVESVGVLLESYFFENRPTVFFDYTLVRPAGEPLKRFGGVAAGPGPLIDLHEAIRDLFDGREGEKITDLDIGDIMNLEGKCVVAGSNRRSAEIWLGEADNKEFLNAKNYLANPDRMGVILEDGQIKTDEEGKWVRTEDGGWGQLSNNSIFARVGGNYDNIIENIQLNGEPGLLYLDLARAYGRLADPPNNRDYRVVGVNPCAEQSLEHLELCTLVETFPHHHEDYEDFRQTLKSAYLYAKAVTLLPTQWPESNEVMQRNRRIGCSVSGLAQFVETRGVNTLREWLDKGYEFICHRDTVYSEWLGVRESNKKTSVKPSGTVAIIAGATPGGHWPTAGDEGNENEYIRRQRFSASDPLVPYFIEAGYHVEPDVQDPRYTVVVEFPTRGPLVRTETQVSVWEKAMLAAMLQRWWADNQVSVTLTFKESERDEIGPIIRNFDGQLKSVSFLPIYENGGAYAQMPYEGLKAGQRDEMIANIKPINWDEVYEGSANDAEGERFCNNDVCELPRR